MCLFLASYRSAAQTVPVVQQVQNRTVAVMPFIGDDPEKNNRVRDRVFQEVENHPNYTPISISSETQPETLRLRPDEPPDLMYLGDMPFVLTGEYYLDIDAQEHFQLWLWNSQDGSLVYTDELVAENIEEAESYLPALVSWVFSRIPRTPEMRVAVDLQGAVDLKGAMEDVIARSSRSTDDPSPSGQASFPRLYLGMGMGGSFSTFYIRMTGTYAPSMSQGFGLIAGLSLGFRPWRFFIVQIDPLFSVDVFRVFTIRLENNQNVHTSSQQITTPMLFPLLIRVPIMEDKFNISFAAGVYFTIPIGRLSDEWGAYSIRQDLPLGFIGGMDLGYTIDPGELFFSLRYARDLGMTIVSSGLQYVQSRVTLSIGYRFGFFRKQPPESGTITLTGSGTLSGTGTGAGVLTGTGAAATGTAGTAEAPPIQEQSVEEVWEEFEPGETGLATVGDEPEAE